MASSWRALAESLDRVAARLDHVPGAYDEQQELRALAVQAGTLEPGTRATAFLDALTDARRQLREAGAPDRAVVFSESRATLSFLEKSLSGNGYAGRIVTHQPGAAGKKALAAFASGEADILLATDAAGVGVDLSHCALVVNYDLPWNVQKLEQRISRCHRYGQKHDLCGLSDYADLFRKFAESGGIMKDFTIRCPHNKAHPSRHFAVAFPPRGGCAHVGTLLS